MSYISSQSITASMRTSLLQLQKQLNKAETEVSTGHRQDIGIELGAETGQVLSLSQTYDHLQALSTSNNVTSTRLNATDSVLGNIQSLVSKFSSALVQAQGDTSVATTLKQTAQEDLSALVASLNTSIGGQFIFAGINSSARPVTDYQSTPPSPAKQAFDTAFQARFGFSASSSQAATISAADMQTFLDTDLAGQFSDPGWGTLWSQASSTPLSAQVAPDLHVTTSVSANETAFRQLAQALTMVSEFGGTNLGAGASQAVITSATRLVNQALNGLTALQSGVGVTQASITQANDTLSAQMATLNTSLNSMEGVDSYTLSSTISSLQTQIEASYQLTSQLQKLSLVSYLR